MKRIVYYIIQATAEENQAGTFHYSKPFENVEKVKVEAQKIHNDFVGIEKHHEYFITENKSEYQWQIDHNFDIKQIEF